MGHLKTTISLLAIAALALGTHQSAAAQEAHVKRAGVTATLAALPGEWRTLTGADFRGYDKESIPLGWTAVGGEFTKSRPVGDLMTKDQFANFELEFEWKIGKGGNSGVFYRGTTEYDHIYWSAPEYQLLDDANAPDGKLAITSAGSDYALYGPPRGIVKPHDEWNQSRIVVNGAHVEHWLNGTKVVTYELWSPEWKAKVAASKFAKYPNYGMAKTGYVGIQGDHPGTLAVRNIRIRTLP